MMSGLLFCLHVMLLRAPTQQQRDGCQSLVKVSPEALACESVCVFLSIGINKSFAMRSRVASIQRAHTRTPVARTRATRQPCERNETRVASDNKRIWRRPTRWVFVVVCLLSPRVALHNAACRYERHTHNTHTRRPQQPLLRANALLRLLIILFPYFLRARSFAVARSRSDNNASAQHTLVDFYLTIERAPRQPASQLAS